MTALGAVNVVYPAFRNALVGDTSDYNIDTAFYSGLTTAVYGTFIDHAVTIPADGDVFASTYTTAETPAYANRLAIGTLVNNNTNTIATAGYVDCPDTVFSTGNIVGDTGVTGQPVESYVLYRLITAQASSPLLVYYGSATGLPLTPNGAAVTVVYNTSGLFRV